MSHATVISFAKLYFLVWKLLYKIAVLYFRQNAKLIVQECNI